MLVYEITPGVLCTVQREKEREGERSVSPSHPCRIRSPYRIIHRGCPDEIGLR